MREKLLIFVCTCLGLTLIFGLVLGGTGGITEELDADIMAYNSDTSYSQFSEVIDNLDVFVDNCEEEQAAALSGGTDNLEVMGAVTVGVVVETQPAVTEPVERSPKEIKDAVAVEETTESETVTTVATTKPKPAVTTAKPKPVTTTAVTTVTTVTEKPKAETTVKTTTTKRAEETTKAETTKKVEETTVIVESPTEVDESDEIIYPDDWEDIEDFEADWYVEETSETTTEQRGWWVTE